MGRIEGGMYREIGIQGAKQQGGIIPLLREYEMSPVMAEVRAVNGQLVYFFGVLLEVKRENISPLEKGHLWEIASVDYSSGTPHPFDPDTIHIDNIERLFAPGGPSFRNDVQRGTIEIIKLR